MTTPRITAPLVPVDAASPRAYMPRRRPSVAVRAWERLGWNTAVLLEVVILLALWQLVIHGLHMWNPLFVPAPSDIGEALATMIRDGSLWRNFSYSIQNFVIGYLIAAVLGVVFGFMLAGLLRFRAASMPFFWIAYMTPRMAIQPLLVIWFGFGVLPKVLIIFLMAFFPVVLAVYEGARETDPSLIRAAKVFGLKGFGLYRKIVLPAALPYVLTGLRIGIARALVGVVIGEFIGGNAGLGYAIQFAGQEFRVAQGLAVALVLVILANLSMVVLDMIKRRLAPWDTADARKHS